LDMAGLDMAALDMKESCGSNHETCAGAPAEI
jgi:hypothetical protein